jgi:transposase
MGTTANHALYKARSIVKAQDKSCDKTKLKRILPKPDNCAVPVYYYLSKSKNFDYFIKVPNLFTKKQVVYIPGKSHKALNKSLKNGWTLTTMGEIKRIGEKLYFYIFVEKYVEKATMKKECLGVDVGINKSISLSDGYKGPSLSKIIAKFKNKIKERTIQRAKHHRKMKNRSVFKSYIKQILDKEAKLTVARCSENNLS